MTKRGACGRLSVGPAFPSDRPVVTGDLMAGYLAAPGRTVLCRSLIGTQLFFRR